MCPVCVGPEYGSQGPHPVESPVNLEKPAKNGVSIIKNMNDYFAPDIHVRGRHHPRLSREYIILIP